MEPPLPREAEGCHQAPPSRPRPSDREPVSPLSAVADMGNPRRPAGLNAQTAHDSRLEGTSLDHHVQTAQQLNSDDLRNVPGAEEHALERHIQVTQTPVRKELIVEHTKQYRGSGNVLSSA